MITLVLVTFIIVLFVFIIQYAKQKKEHNYIQKCADDSSKNILFIERKIIALKYFYSLENEKLNESDKSAQITLMDKKFTQNTFRKQNLN
jgi:hypothetical protein